MTELLLWRVHRVRPFAVCVAATAALVGCGGGGGSSGSAGPTVSAASVTSGAIRYSQSVVITVNGSGLDQGLTLSSSVCGNPVLGATAPYASGATTAYVLCTPSAVGAGDVKLLRTSDGAILAVVPLTVPVPQVTLSVSNGAGTTGTMVITLAPDKAPATVANFLSYVNSGFYVGTLFHRVAPGFVVQAGGYVAPLVAAPGTLKAPNAPIALEANASNVQWSLSMARSAANPNSATSQFFINLVDNSATLDASPINGPGYAVFGSVTGGTSAVTAIVGAPCLAIPLFLPSGECTPIPNLAIVSAMQTQ